MHDATLCFLMKGGKILLGMKKRGFGANKYNGAGGKVKAGENLIPAAVRELSEEFGVVSKELRKVAELSFFFPVKTEWSQVVHVFVADSWDGEVRESDEMKPEWVPIDKIPYEKMWQDDKHWLPLVLQGKKLKASFHFHENNESIKEYEINEIDNFS